jgi:hypothetical protein
MALAAAASAPVTVSVLIAYVRVAKATASLFRSSTPSLLFENVSHASC